MICYRNGIELMSLSQLVDFVGVGTPGNIGKTEYPVTMVNVPQIDVIFNINTKTIFRERYGPIADPVGCGSIYPRGGSVWMLGKLKIEIVRMFAEERYEHVLRVTETAKKLAERFAIPVDESRASGTVS